MLRYRVLSHSLACCESHAHLLLCRLRNELTRYRSDVFPQLNQQIENLESEIKQHSAGMDGKLKSRPFLFKADSFSKSMSRRNSTTSEKSPPGSRRNSYAP